MKNRFCEYFVTLYHIFLQKSSIMNKKRYKVSEFSHFILVHLSKTEIRGKVLLSGLLFGNFQV